MEVLLLLALFFLFLFYKLSNKPFTQIRLILRPVTNDFVFIGRELYEVFVIRDENLLVLEIIHLVCTQNFPKNYILPLICTRACAYHGVKNVSFPENFVYVLNEWSLLQLSTFFTNSIIISNAKLKTPEKFITLFLKKNWLFLTV